MSQLEVLNQKGDVTTALTVEGVVDRIAVDPGDPRGLYLRLYKSRVANGSACTAARTLRLRHAPRDGDATVKGLLGRPTDLTQTLRTAAQVRASIRAAFKSAAAPGVWHRQGRDLLW